MAIQSGGGPTKVWTDQEILVAANVADLNTAVNAFIEFKETDLVYNYTCTPGTIVWDGTNYLQPVVSTWVEVDLNNPYNPPPAP